SGFTATTYLAFASTSNCAFISKVGSGGQSKPFTTLLAPVSGSVSGIAVDAAGSIYLAGTARGGSSFLGGGAPRGQGDAFLIRLDNDGQTLAMDALLGGTGDEFGFGLAVDKDGGAILVGRTSSADFPLTKPFQSVLRSRENGFIVKLQSAR